MLKVVQTGAQLLERALLVLDLRTLLLALDHQAGGDMREAHRRVGGVHSLSSGARRAEEVEPDVVPAQVHVEFAGLGEHGDRCRRSLDTSLGLGLGHSLDAVHAGFIFHHPVDSVAAGQLEDYLLEAAGSAGRLVGHLDLPAAGFGVMLVHAEEVAREDRRLVAAGAAAYLDYGVLAVVGVGGDQQQLDLLLLGGHTGLDLGDLGPCHLPELIVLLVDEYVLGRSEVADHLLIFPAGLDDRLQLLVVLVQLHVALHVRHHLGARQLVLKLLELVLQRKHLVK